MASSAPSQAQLRAKTAHLRKERPGELVIGFHIPGPWEGVAALRIDNELLPVRSCQSALEVREALLSSDATKTPLVIVTPLEATELEVDVLARLARGRLQVIRVWEVVQEAYGLRGVDPRLSDELWMADALLELRSAEPGRGVPSGFLDADTAWDMVAEGLGLSTGRPDVLELLRWALHADVDHYKQAVPALREGLRRRVGETAGHAGEAVLACIGSARGEDVVSVGLVCNVVFSPDAPPDSRIALERAAVRLEAYHGQRSLAAAAGRAWAEASQIVLEDLIQERGFNPARSFIVRADAILQEIEAQDFAWLGRWSIAGFEQRLAQCGQALAETLDQAQPSVTASLSAPVVSLRRHGLAGVQPERVERVEMAVRLLRWLADGTYVNGARSFEEAAHRYLLDGGFADWIRGSLEVGDGSEPLSAAFSKLLAQAAVLQERASERFGKLLAEWVAAGSSLRSAVAIEDVLAGVVAKVAEHEPVLVLVVDGMSVAVYRELAQDLATEGWIELIPAGGPGPVPVIAAFPTVTEVSRASLLSGRLVRGVAADEKASFEANAALLKRTGRKQPPILFHKADLADAGEAGLAATVRAELADPDRKVVGIVLNAVDDHLAKGDQIRPRWGIETIRPLRSVLHAAQQAGRIVVITADHGHIPERGSELRSHAEGERWRLDDGSSGPGEVVLAGPRVVQPPQRRLIAPWSERLRYGMRKNGYHGGASPQEVVVPLGVFTPGIELKGWVEAATTLPAWWSGEAGSAPAGRPAVLRKKARQPLGQRELFVPALNPPRPPADWLAALFGSQVWKAQVQAASRVSVDADRVRQALMAIEERGGRLTRQALALKLGLPPVRINGFVVALRRVLNVEGYEVLAFDDPSDTLALNLDLLRKQFELP